MVSLGHNELMIFAEQGTRAYNINLCSLNHDIKVQVHLSETIFGYTKHLGIYHVYCICPLQFHIKVQCIIIVKSVSLNEGVAKYL